MKRKSVDHSGFTLLELLIAMVISGFVIAGIYSVYAVQRRTYTVQDQMSEMQQKLRAGMDILTSDFRMAAYDPGGSCGAGIEKAEINELKFKTCLDNDEFTLTFKLYDAYGDGISDLGRQKDATTRPIAEGIDAVEFLYLDEDNVQLSSPVSDTGKIRSVQVSVLARANFPDRKYTNTTKYIPASGATDWNIASAAANPPNDNLHRRLLITSVQLRNMGLSDE